LGSTLASKSDLEDALYWVARGKIKPVIDSVYSLEQASEAHTKMLKGNLFGKIIMKP
jgi:NADPH:quinone reductase-like Zn-dependent oxidoreductase